MIGFRGMSAWHPGQDGPPEVAVPPFHPEVAPHPELVLCARMVPRVGAAGQAGVCVAGSVECPQNVVVRVEQTVVRHLGTVTAEVYKVNSALRWQAVVELDRYA